MHAKVFPFLQSSSKEPSRSQRKTTRNLKEERNNSNIKQNNRAKQNGRFFPSCIGRTSTRQMCANVGLADKKSKASSQGKLLLCFEFSFFSSLVLSLGMHYRPKTWHLHNATQTKPAKKQSWFSFPCGHRNQQAKQLAPSSITHVLLWGHPLVPLLFSPPPRSLPISIVPSFLRWSVLFLCPFQLLVIFIHSFIFALRIPMGG